MPLLLVFDCNGQYYMTFGTTDRLPRVEPCKDSHSAYWALAPFESCLAAFLDLARCILSAIDERLPETVAGY
jgi:hypothetical protein